MFTRVYYSDPLKSYCRGLGSDTPHSTSDWWRQQRRIDHYYFLRLLFDPRLWMDPFPMKLPLSHQVSLSVGQQVIRSVSRSVGRSVFHQVSRSLCQQVRMSLGQQVIMSVGQYVSRSECQYIISLCQFVIRSVYMKLTSLEFQKLTKPNFSENSHFWEKVQTFLYHWFFCLQPKNLIY